MDEGKKTTGQDILFPILRAIFGSRLKALFGIRVLCMVLAACCLARHLHPLAFALFLLAVWTLVRTASIGELFADGSRHCVVFATDGDMTILSFRTVSVFSSLGHSTRFLARRATAVRLAETSQGGNAPTPFGPPFSAEESEFLSSFLSKLVPAARIRSFVSALATAVLLALFAVALRLSDGTFLPSLAATLFVLAGLSFLQSIRTVALLRSGIDNPQKLWLVYSECASRLAWRPPETVVHLVFRNGSRCQVRLPIRKSLAALEAESPR